MENITELRKELTEVFKDLRDGSLEPSVATEMNNSAGKIIKSLAIQLEYASLRQEKPNIPYIK